MSKKLMTIGQARAARAAFDALTISEKVELHNRYCNVCNLPDELIESMGAWLDEDLQWMKPADAFRIGIMAGAFCFTDEWVTFDGNGNIKSSNDPAAAGWISTLDIIDWVLDHGEAEQDPAQWFGGIRADEY